MKRILAIGALALVGFAGTASAGKFEVWSDAAKGNRAIVVVSFAGDGKTQDAQADIAYGSNWTLEKAEAKVAGSVCVGLPGQAKIRVVPPSGAGTALTSKATDYCSFTFKTSGAKSAAALTFDFIECASPQGGHDCSNETVDLAK